MSMFVECTAVVRKKMFQLLLGICVVGNIVALRSLSLTFLDYKGVKRGIIASCGFDRTVYQYSGSYFISYFDLESQNEKFRIFAAKISEVSAAVGIVVNLDCDGAKETIQNISSFSLFNNRNWLLVSRNITAAKDLLTHLDIHLNSDVSVGIPGAAKSYKLYEAYKIEQSNLIFTEAESDFRANETFAQLWKITRRRNLRGLRLEGGITLPSVNNSYDAMVTYLESKGNAYSNIMQRKNYRIARVLAEMFNFSVGLVQANEWGSYENNRWNGAIGLVSDMRANFSITTVQMSIPRYNVVDFLPPTHIGLLAFVFRHPKSVSLRNVFLEPFKDSVWVAVFTLSIVFTVIFCYIAKFEEPSLVERSASNLGILTFGTIVQQGTTNAFTLFSGRILLTSILFLAFMLYQFYSAFLVGSLLSEPPKTINTPEKLYNSRLRLGMEKLAYQEYLMNITSDISRRILLNRILNQNKDNAISINEGLELIKKGGFAFHVDTLGAYQYLTDTMTDRRFCELKIIRMIPKVISSIVVPKHAPLKEYFLNGVLRMMEFGVLDYQDKYWRPNVPNCEMVGNTVDDIEVGMEPMFPAFLMIGTMMLLSLALFSLECVISKNSYKI